jgi:hypothetical protein
VVVPAAFLVVADYRRGGVERRTRVTDNRQHLVLDVDQLEGVAGRVTVVRERERDLLSMRAHLVGREHGLGIVRHRRHPRQAACFEVLPGQYQVDLRVRERGRGVDRDNPGVGQRAAQEQYRLADGELDRRSAVPPSRGTSPSRICLIVISGPVFSITNPPSTHGTRRSRSRIACQASSIGLAVENGWSSSTMLVSPYVDSC